MVVIAFALLVLLVIVGLVAFVVARSSSEAPEHSHPANPAPPTATPALAPIDPATLPREWGWCQLNDPTGARSIGFNYVDKTAGPSFRIVVDLGDSPSAEQIAERAVVAGYRGSTIVRLNGHEWVNGEFASALGDAFMQERPPRPRVISLSAAQLVEYKLPPAPGWVGVYLS